MPFNRTVAKQFFKDYKNHLTQEAKTKVGQFSNFLSSTLGYKNSSDNRDDCQKFEDNIDKIKDSKAVVELILELGRTAHTIQGKTMFHNSTCSETMHAVRDFIIRSPKDAKELEYSFEYDDLPEKIQAKLKEIRKLLNDKEVELAVNMSRKEKVSAEVCYGYMRDLFYLGDRSILRNPDELLKIFPTSHYRWKDPLPNNKNDDLNENYPIIAQENFAEMQVRRFNPKLKANILNEFAKIALTIDDLSEDQTTPEFKSANKANLAIKQLIDNVNNLKQNAFTEVSKKNPSDITKNEAELIESLVTKYDFKLDTSSIESHIKSSGDFQKPLSDKLTKAREQFTEYKKTLDIASQKVEEKKKLDDQSSVLKNLSPSNTATLLNQLGINQTSQLQEEKNNTIRPPSTPTLLSITTTTNNQDMIQEQVITQQKTKKHG